MFLERIMVGFAIIASVFALGHVALSITSVHKPPPPVEVVRPPDAKALLKRLETLDQRLQEAQTRIDEVLASLANAREDAERDATRVRLDVLYRLESGLTADIAHTRDELARVSSR